MIGIMFLLYVISKVMSPANWLSDKQRAVKLEQMERRLQDWDHREYVPARKTAEAAKTVPLSTC